MIFLILWNDFLKKFIKNLIDQYIYQDDSKSKIYIFFILYVDEGKRCNDQMPFD